MIRIPFDPDRLNARHLTFFDEWRERAAEAATRTADEEQPEPERRAAVWRDFKAWITEHFFSSKCAYCEGPLDAQTAGAAEHWRPKLGVQEPDEDGAWKRVTDPQTDKRHSGYWWVAFDWENLVPACSMCNEKKGTKFPIAGDRVYEPATANCSSKLDEIEKPLLLHPFRGEDPAEHIGFRPDGFAYAKTPPGQDQGGQLDPRATETMLVCDLNRYGLTKDRLLAQRSAIDRLAKALVLTLDDPDLDIDAYMEDWDGPSAKYSRAVADALGAPEEGLKGKLTQRLTRR
jgi:hypothetical protein